MDKTVGMLLEYLEKEGWMENSIIVVASDNGGCPTSGGSNYPPRGIKHSYWEGGVKARKLGLACIWEDSYLSGCIAARNVGLHAEIGFCGGFAVWGKRSFHVLDR